MDLNASYLITFRDTDGSRTALLESVMAWLAQLPWLEVIVVEQDESPGLAEKRLPPNVTAMFVRNDGVFNKSWGLNVAARRATHDLLVTADADMIMSREALARAVTICGRRFDAVNPYSNLVDLSRAETAAFLRNGSIPDSPGRIVTQDRRPEGEFICFCGGICVFRRDVYFELGGMDEEFLGWGGEDDAMSINLSRYTDRLAIQQDTMAYHLWHRRPPERYSHPHYRRNVGLVGEYRRLDDAGLSARRAAQRVAMGDPARYQGST